MKNNKNKLNPHFFRKMSNGLDIALMFYKTRLNPQQTQKGNTLLIGIGFGLLVMLLGGLAIAKANNNKINANIDTATSQTGSITEAGINNLIGQLTQNSTKPLLLRSFDPNDAFGEGAIDEWTTGTTEELALPGGVNSCGGADTADQAADQLQTITVDPNTGVAINDVPVGSGDAGGTYKIVAYRYSDPDATPQSGDEFGRLMVDGKLGKQSDSKSRLMVQFPVNNQPGGPGTTALPGIMASKVNIQSSQTVAGGIICTDPDLCPINCTTDTNGSPDEADYSELKSAIGAGGIVKSYNTSEPQVTIQVVDATIPPIPAVPAACTSTITDIGTVQKIQGKGKTLPDDGGTPCEIDFDNDGDLDTVYYYQSSGIDKTSISINTTAQIRLYISGNIDQQGNDDIRLTNASATPPPGQIRIYAGFTDGTAPTVTSWALGGNACNMAFIHAPTLDIGINGGGDGCSGIGLDDAVRDANSAGITGTLVNPQNTNIYGAVWAKSYNETGNSSSSSMFYQQPGLLETLNAEGLLALAGADDITTGSIANKKRMPFP